MGIELSGVDAPNEWADYKGAFGMMGLPVMSEKWWSTVVSWLGGHVEELANVSCTQVH